MGFQSLLIQGSTHTSGWVSTISVSALPIRSVTSRNNVGSRDGAQCLGFEHECTTAVPAFAASIAATAISAGVIGTLSDLVVSPDPVTAQVINTFWFISVALLFLQHGALDSTKSIKIS